MSDDYVNGIDIIPAPDDAAPAPIEVEKRSIGMATVPVPLERDQQSFELTLREPGIVRGCAIMLTQPKVIGANGMRGVAPLVSPVMFVECDPARDIRPRRFMWVESDAIIKLPIGVDAQWRATAVSAPHVRHLYEIVQVAS